MDSNPRILAPAPIQLTYNVGDVLTTFNGKKKTLNSATELTLLVISRFVIIIYDYVDLLCPKHEIVQ
jgi:hypothetical protein